MRFGLDEIAEACGGRVARAPKGVDACDGVSVDSRSLAGGQLFVPLRAERDGHDFIEDAVGAGAPAYLREERAASGGALAGAAIQRAAEIVVPDSLEALGQLGRLSRARLTARVGAIAGSTGKTTTKDMLGSIAVVAGSTTVSERSYNNEIGLPLTLCAASPEDRTLVAEVGARRRGDLALLAEMLRPLVGVVTNIGEDHFELFGSRRAIAETNAELLEALAPDGSAVIPSADDFTELLAEKAGCEVVTFGLEPGPLGEPAVRAEQISMDRYGCCEFTIVVRATGPRREAEARVALAIPGRHQVQNALGAAAGALALGFGIEQVRDGLGAATVSPWRSEILETPEGAVVLNDAYNANPQSMAAALSLLDHLASAHRPIAVLGEMAELGPISHEEHLHVGREAASIAGGRLALLVVVGAGAGGITEGALDAGLASACIRVAGDAAEATAAVRSHLKAGDAVLVKASRVAGLEAVAHSLAGLPGGAGQPGQAGQAGPGRGQGTGRPSATGRRSAAGGGGAA